MNQSDANDQPQTGPGHGKLGLWDAVCIIVGIVIGSSIFKTPPIIFQNVAGAWEGMGVWALGGVLSLIGAFCYAELATTYPRSGGDYVYLTRAFGRPVGFLFGWAQLVVILSGSTAMMAFIFGEYSADLFNVATKVKETELKTRIALIDQKDEAKVKEAKSQAEAAGSTAKATFATQAAFGAVLFLSLINFFGVVLGKWVQNLLVLVKLVGLGAIVVVGLYYGSGEGWTGGMTTDKGFGLALILVLYAYGGWNDAAFVAADMRDRKLIPRALILGTIGITLIYLAVNAAYILSLGFSGARDFRLTIAADVFVPLGDFGSKAISLLVMVSALGAMNGLIFTGSRVYSSLGKEHSVFSLLGRWNRRFNAPIWSLLVQAIIALAMIFLVGTEEGRSGINNIATSIGLPAIPWAQYFGGFDTLFAGTAPVFWTFFFLTGVSVFVLRVMDRGIERPFRLRFPWFPLLPLIFCATCIYGFWSAITYAKFVSFIGWVPLLLGLPLFFLSRHTSVHSRETPEI
jgi:amino acid transporter